MNIPALLVLDLQNEMVHRDGVIGSTGFADIVEERGLINKVRQVLDAFREAGAPVVFVRVGFRADYADAMSRAPRVRWLQEQGGAVLGSWGCEIHETLSPRPDEMIITKQAVNPFFNTGLLLWLLRKQVETLVLCGVHTHMVVDATARAADDSGFVVRVMEDCCASPDPEMHKYEMERILPLFGEVLSSELVIDSLRP